MSSFDNALLVALAFALVVLNGFFVAAEFSLVKLRTTRAQELSTQNGWRGRILGKVHGQLDTYLSACQLGITLSSLGLGWVGEPAFASLLEPLLTMAGIDNERTMHTIAFIVAFTVISFLHIVIGELAPKSMAIRQPEGVSLWTATPLYAFYWLMYPAIELLNRSANIALKAAGLEGTGGHDANNSYTHDELKMILHLSHAAGDKPESNLNIMLAHTLELQDLVASDLMRTRREMIGLDHDSSHAEVRRIVQKYGYSRYPLLDEDEAIVGVVHVKDLLLEPPGDDYPQRLRRLARDIHRFREDTPALEVLRRFRQGAPHLALVDDFEGTMDGFVTLEDVLEAMLGEIVDEYEPRRAGQVDRRIVHLADGSLLLRGDTPVYRLERVLGAEIDGSEDVDTVAGLVMQKLDRIAVRGDQIVIGAHEITVQRVTGPRIERIKVMRRVRSES
ncbi:hemolysin family protein [Nevskia ramosa]|uniref:hemolysin family protein n=1 Tax=Nevskia ramosa TaxID=64002 RepID=UPI0023569F2F|nr:hemolysin family protein [Nevskia ramosa]